MKTSAESSRKGLWRALMVVGACAACCALPLLGVVGAGFASSAALATFMEGEIKIVLLAIAAASGVFFTILLKRRQSARATAARCETECAVDRSCCGSEDSRTSNTSCSLSEAELDRRFEEFRVLLPPHFVRASRQGTTVLWRLRAASGVEEESRRLAALEEGCCSGLHFKIERANDEVVWKITGTPLSDDLLTLFEHLPERIRQPNGVAAIAMAVEESRKGACT